MSRTYEIEPKAVGCGWKLAVYEDGVEIGGGVFPADENDDDSVDAAYSDALEVAYQMIGNDDADDDPDDSEPPQIRTAADLVAIRKANKLTQVGLAQMIGRSRRTIQLWEKGEVAIQEPAARLIALKLKWKEKM